MKFKTKDNKIAEVTVFVKHVYVEVNGTKMLYSCYDIKVFYDIYRNVFDVEVIDNILHYIYQMCIFIPKEEYEILKEYYYPEFFTKKKAEKEAENKVTRTHKDYVKQYKLEL